MEKKRRIRIRKEVYEELRRIAEIEGKSVNELAEKLLTV